MQNRISTIAFFLFILKLVNINAQVVTHKLWPEGIPGLILNDNYVEKATINEGVTVRFEKVTDPAI